MTRTAISPRLAIRIFFSTGDNLAPVDPSNANQHRTWRVSTVAETGSTNADLLLAGEQGAADGTVLRAEHQTAGRGRLDRTWEAPPGANLLVSILLAPAGERPHDVVRAVALAAVRACRETCAVEVSLKWPNDLCVGTDKIAGILAQRGRRADGSGDFVVVGIGVNVGWAPPGAASLSSAGWERPVTPAELCDALLAELDAALALGHDDLHADYVAHLATLGQRVRIETADAALVGTAEAVDAEGRIVVRGDDGNVSSFDTADVVHLRPHEA